MAQIIRYARNDTLNPLQLTGPSFFGDITSWTINAFLKKPISGIILNKLMVVTDGPNREYQINWLAGDLDEIGDYPLQVEHDTGSGTFTGEGVSVTVYDKLSDPVT